MPIPPYPFHLSIAEREAVADKAARDIVKEALAGISGSGPVSLHTVLSMIAPLSVALQWAGQHVAELERQIKETK